MMPTTRSAEYRRALLYYYETYVAAACSLAGRCRSATVVLSCLIRTRMLTYDDALRVVRKARRVASPNYGLR